MIGTKAKTILFVSHYSEMYGANKSMCQLILELRENHGVLPIVLLRLRGSICGFFEDNKIKYIVSHYYWWVYEGKSIKTKLHSLIKLIRNRKRANKVYHKLNGEKIDLVYTNSVTINIGVYLSRRLSCPHIWHIRESMKQFDFHYSMGRVFSKLHFRNAADRYILISDFLKESYRSYLPNSRVKRVYNGIKLESKYRKKNVVTDAFHICLIGILSENKNQMDALKALKELVKKWNIKNIHLHLIGGAKKEYKQLIQEFVNSNSLSDNITLYGHQNDINPILSRMNLGLMCSRDEAFGRVTIEYMLNRMPVIASRSGANEELIEIGRNGETYELYKAEDLANKILSFISKPDLLETYGSYAQDFALTNFSSKKNSDTIYQIIEEVTGK